MVTAKFGSYGPDDYAHAALYRQALGCKRMIDDIAGLVRDADNAPGLDLNARSGKVVVDSFATRVDKPPALEGPHTSLGFTPISPDPRLYAKPEGWLEPLTGAVAEFDPKDPARIKSFHTSQPSALDPDQTDSAYLINDGKTALYGLHSDDPRTHQRRTLELSIDQATGEMTVTDSDGWIVQSPVRPPQADGATDPFTIEFGPRKPAGPFPGSEWQTDDPPIVRHALRPPEARERMKGAKKAG